VDGGRTRENKAKENEQEEEKEEDAVKRPGQQAGVGTRAVVK